MSGLHPELAANRVERRPEPAPGETQPDLPVRRVTGGREHVLGEAVQAHPGLREAGWQGAEPAPRAEPAVRAEGGEVFVAPLAA